MMPACAWAMVRSRDGSRALRGTERSCRLPERPSRVLPSCRGWNSGAAPNDVALRGAAVPDPVPRDADPPPLAGSPHAPGPGTSVCTTLATYADTRRHLTEGCGP